MRYQVHPRMTAHGPRHGRRSVVTIRQDGFICITVFPAAVSGVAAGLLYRHRFPSAHRKTLPEPLRYFVADMMVV